jgi:uncharacterized repeat protein (TIGR01451 family)
VSRSKTNSSQKKINFSQKAAAICKHVPDGLVFAFAGMILYRWMNTPYSSVKILLRAGLPGFRALNTFWTAVCRSAALLGLAAGLTLRAAPGPGIAAPTVSGVTATSNSTSIFGSLAGIPNTTYQIDYYYGATLQGSGSIHLGASSVTTDASGKASLYTSFPISIPAGSYLTATATEAGNTSAFASPVQFNSTDTVNLALTVSASSNSVLLGDQTTLTLTVSNSGTNTATGVILNDWLPPMFNYVFSTVSQGTATNAGNTVSWEVGNIPSGGIASMTVYASGINLGAGTNWAVVQANDFNANYANSTNQMWMNCYVPAGPTINNSPPNLVTSLLNSVLNLVVQATGSGNVNYQWRLNGADIPGATNSTYTVLSLLQENAGQYTAVVSDQTGAVIVPPALVLLGSLLALPASDNFASRGTLLTLPTSLLPLRGNNTNATSEPGEPLHAGVPGGKSVWFSWTPLLGGVATLTTKGSSFDTLLAVYTGNNLTNLTPVVSDDDSGGFYTSTVTFNAVAGTTYTIAIDGAYGASGEIVFSGSVNILGLLAPPLPSITSQPADQIVSPGAPATFTASASGTGLSYQWNYNDVPIPGATKSSLLVKNVSAANVGLYSLGVTNSTGGVLSRHATLQISLLDGSLNTNGIAQDKMQAIYYLVNSGSLNNNVQSANVQSSIARPMSGGGTSRGYSSSQTFSTYGGSTQSGEPNSCQNVGGSSSWTSIQAPNNGILSINTTGSSFVTILGIYTGNGNDFSSLTQIACSVGSTTNSNSSVSFAATSNTVYYIAVDGVNRAYGTVVLNWNLSVPPTITAQPGSQTVAPGTNVTLSANASGYITPSCQWLLNGSKISGATNWTLTITNFQAAKAGNYQMRATNNVGSATTSTASILPNNALHLDSFCFNRTNQTCQMRLVGTANSNYVIQASTDMRNWVTVATNNPSSGLWTFSDTCGTNQPRRFYRAKIGP